MAAHRSRILPIPGLRPSRQTVWTSWAGGPPGRMYCAAALPSARGAMYASLERTKPHRWPMPLNSCPARTCSCEGIRPALGSSPVYLSRHTRRRQRTNAVSNGTGKAQVSLTWAFGSGELSQTYLYTQDGSWHESRTSLCTKFGNLDITTGHSALPPESLQAALGRGMSIGAARQCFSCHTTGATTEGHFQPDPRPPVLPARAAMAPVQRMSPPCQTQAIPLPPPS